MPVRSLQVKMEVPRVEVGIPKHADVTSSAPERASEPSPAELRQHFARELHDQVSHPLVELVMTLQEARTEAGVPAATAAQLAGFEDLARNVLRQAREMMIDLRGRGELSLDLGGALRTDIRVPLGRTLTVDVSPRWPLRTNGWAAFNLLRISQQAVGNAWRHGRARNAEVALDIAEGDDAVLRVTDDGVGIDETAYGFGVDGMRERAVILGGSFKATAGRGAGTVVEVRVPLRNVI